MANVDPIFPGTVICNPVTIASNSAVATSIYPGAVDGARLDAIHVNNTDAVNGVTVTLTINNGTDFPLGSATVTAGSTGNILVASNFAFLEVTGALLLAATDSLKVTLDGGGDGSDVHLIAMGGGY